jgi:hypothetical protein
VICLDFEFGAHKSFRPISYYRAQRRVSLGDSGQLNTKSDKIQTSVRSYRADSYILLSAGYDGLYGTADDVCNFEWTYRGP